jgi:hypothetical protein
VRNFPKAAVDRVVIPLVEEAVAALRADRNSKAISRLRKQAEALATNPGELKLVRKLLHQPTLLLRQGGDGSIDEQSLLTEMEEEILAARAVAGSSSLKYSVVGK